MPPPIRRTGPGTPTAPTNTTPTTPTNTPVATPTPGRGWTPATPGTIRTPADGFGGPARTTTGSGAQIPLADQLFLSQSGHFVSRSGQDRPVTALEQGETLFRAAQLAESGKDLFGDPRITLEQKTAALSSLKAAFSQANPSNPQSGGFQNADQALQTRASAAPLMVDLAKSLDPAKPADKALQGEVVSAYLELLQTEPHGLNRNFMIYDLDRAKGQLPDEVRPAIDGLMREVAPLTPPYDQWFKDGNTKLRLEYYVGDGFWDEELRAYEQNGFARKDNPDGTVTLSRRYAHQRELNDGSRERIETNVELVMHNGPQGMFQKMNDPKVHGVIYSGHANYGREVPSHLSGATDQNGAKVFFGLQCGGKGVHNALLERFPDLHVVSSKNSSYGYQDRSTVLNALEGISKRLPWSQISVKNSSSNSDNYYFPSDTLISRRAVDRDRDGKVDSWDRVVNYNTFPPQQDIERQLTPSDPGRPADQLDGRALHGAILRFHRMAGYNEWAEGQKDQGVLNAGFFEGKRQDPLYRLTEVRGEDGQNVYKLQVNSQYGHANEEVLGAALHYELGRTFAQRAGLSGSDAKAAGLLMAAKALDVDTGYEDEAAWKALLRYAGLPERVSFSDAMHANHANEHYSAGASDTLRAFKQSLSSAGIAIE